MSVDIGALNDRPWVVVGPRGVLWLGLAKDERDAWRVALGWPDEDEIEYAKASGFRAAEAKVSWQ